MNGWSKLAPNRFPVQPGLHAIAVLPETSDARTEVDSTSWCEACAAGWHSPDRRSGWEAAVYSAGTGAIWSLTSTESVRTGRTWQFQACTGPEHSKTRAVHVWDPVGGKLATGKIHHWLGIFFGYSQFYQWAANVFMCKHIPWLLKSTFCTFQLAYQHAVKKNQNFLVGTGIASRNSTILRENMQCRCAQHFSAFPEMFLTPCACIVFTSKWINK